MRALYGLIGFPLGHSFSQGYFNERFHAEGIDAEYRNFPIGQVGLLKQLVVGHPELQGLNVTLPYKQQVIPLLQELDPDARQIGAVNVIKIERHKHKFSLKGYNTDFEAFRRSIAPLLKPQHQKALILGTGGASMAVQHALRQLGVEIVKVSRNKQEDVLTYNELTPEIMDSHKIVVNCTPVGMYPLSDKAPDIPYQYLTPDHVVYDLLYNPDTTLFMRKGAAQGAQVKNGLEMLLLQADLSWQIWNDSHPHGLKREP